MKVIVKAKNNGALKPVYIAPPFITLDCALKLVDAVSTGGQAKIIIKDDLVKVNGQVCEVLRKKLYENDTFEYEGIIYVIKIKE